MFGNGIIESIKAVFSADGPEKSGLPPGAINVQGVSKRFRKRTATRKSYSTVKSGLIAGTQDRAPDGNYLQALDDISLEIPPGSALGVIGRNGSGKSTLLKLISGIYQPDRGKIQTSGRISALIELGAGFHPDFSGRENIHLGGVMYGLSRKEIDARFDDIVRYAELEDFIDDPVRTYSSGMYMRLGFSLAIHTDPDILLIDEVLAVGDAGFIHRCHDTISDFKRRGKTLVFVTHDLPSVQRWCDDVIWLEKGVVRDRGHPRRVIDHYMQAVDDEEGKKLVDENQALLRAEHETAEAQQAEDALPPNLAEHDEATRWGNKDVELAEIKMYGRDGEPRWLFSGDEEVIVEVAYQIHKPIAELVFGIGIVRADGLHVHGTNTMIDEREAPLPSAETGGTYPLAGVYRYSIKRLGLTEGSYFIDVAAHREDGLPYDYHHRLHKFSVRNRFAAAGVYAPEHDWEFAPHYRAESPTLTKLKAAGGR